MRFWPIDKAQAITYYSLVFAYIATVITLSSISWAYQVAPIWIPAGIALVGCYLFWWRFIPVLFVVAVLAHFAVHPVASLTNLDFSLASQMAVIAFGLTLQASLGAALLRYWLGDPLNSRSDKHSIGFIIFVGILVNLVSSNIGASALSFSSPNYDNAQHWQTVFYWWLGDSMGVLLTVPFILSVIQIRGSDAESRKTYQMMISASVLLFFSVTLTTLFFSKYKFENAHKLVQSELQTLDNSLHRQFNSSLLDVQILANFVQVTPKLTRESFATYAETLMKKRPHIKALSWNPIIPSRQRRVFEQELAQDYQRPVPILGEPLDSNDPLVVVRYIYPESENEKAIGFNVFSNKNRKQTLIDPELKFQPKATPVIQLVQSDKKEAGFLLFFPVFQRIGPKYALNQGENNPLFGYATGVFVMERIVDSVLSQVQGDIFHYQFYEANSHNIFTSNLDATQKRLLDQPEVTILEFAVAGQVWHLALETKQSFIAQYQSGLTMLILVVQTIIAAFIILLTLLMNSRQKILNLKVKERTRELEWATKQSDNANVAKSRFLANMSHEIRTPLNAVIGFSQLASNSDDGKVIGSYIRKIEQSSKTLLNIVNDILDISKIESEKLVLEHRLFDMHELLAKVKTMFETNANNKQLDWQLVDELPIDLLYIGDSMRIEQILINLCANAFKFTKQGHVMIKARVLQNDQNMTGKLCLCVEDTGIGIEKDQQAHLFHAFTQADSSTTRNFGGTGLGLTISQELSQLMKGGIEVQSEPEKGSTFWVELVLETSREALPEKMLMTRQDISRFRVLVVEDNRINQILIDRMLQSQGIKAVLVDNGQKAVDIIAQQAFDLILMDCQMPVMDGYQATAEIRKLFGIERLPIVALTADVMVEDKARAFAVGFNAHLAKPIDLDKLCDCLQQYYRLSKKSTEGDNRL